MSGKKTSSNITTSWGAPVDDDHNSMTAGEFGPVLIQDGHLIDKIAHFDRERIPERVVHAKGAGAWGYLEVTNDVTQYCKANFLNTVGKRTPLFMRFSTVAGEKGSADTERDPRGFAIKFYTEEGNYDMVGNNTPVFFIRDPLKFPDMIHSFKRNPQTNLKDNNAMFDFMAGSPECAHQITILFSDRGTPKTYRNMNGYSSHTFKWVNKEGNEYWVKMHFKTTDGIKTFTNEEANQMKSQDPDYLTRDLFEHIDKGNTASWTFSVQIMPVGEAFKYKWNVFDVTKVWPHSEYPLQKVGTIVLNRNPENYFQDVEQVAFSPAHLVPGIEPSIDKMLQGRLFSYTDTHRHRLGANYDQIPVNCPYRTKVTNTLRDAPMSVNGNQGSRTNYNPSTYPNSQHTYNNTPDAKWSSQRMTGLVGRYKPSHPNCDFQQPGNLFRTVMTAQQRDSTINTVLANLKGVNRDLQERMAKLFYRIDAEFGERVAKGCGFPAHKSHL